jgi:hypothetical protein
MKYDFTFKLNAVEMYEQVNGLIHLKVLDKKILERGLYNGQGLQIFMALNIFGILQPARNALQSIGTN